MFKGGALGKNHKRVMDVWMDEYKEFIYMRRPHYRNIDPGSVNFAEHVECFSTNFFERLNMITVYYENAVIVGDLTKQKELRDKLKCKSFKWFMEEVAFDQDAHYPAIVPPDFASGIIKSDADPDLCVDGKLHSK